MAELVVPQVDFSILGNLGKVYQEGRRERTLADLGKGLASGTMDYRTAAAKAGEAGNLDVALKLLQMGDEDAAGKEWDRTVLPTYGGGTPAPAAAPSATKRPALGTMSLANLAGGEYAPAVSSIESGGRYDALGPVIEPGRPMAGDRAYGKYQVMGSNVGPWTKEVLGREMTPQEFVASPEAQDAVFKAKFGQYAQKYGPEGASRAWFAGERGMNNPNATDQLGTTVAGYGQKFTAAGGGAPGGSTVPVAPSVPGGGGVSEQVGTLVRALANPRLSGPRRDATKLLLQNALENSKLTNDQKEYLWSVSQGGTDSFTDWMRKNKAAGAIAITNDMRGENEESKALGKGAGERANAMMAAAGAASKKLADINRSAALLDRLRQGKIEPGRMTISAWAKSLGLPDGTAEALGLDPKSVGDAQALNALTAKSVVSMIGQGGFPANNFSDADREFLISTVERLSNDPRANKLILETGRRMAQLDIAKAKEYQAFRRSPANKGKGFADFEIEWNDKIANADLFGDLRKDAEQYIGPPAAAQPGMPSRVDIEAEIKRRGLR